MPTSATTGNAATVSAASSGPRLDAANEPFIATMPPSSIATTVWMPTAGATDRSTSTTSSTAIPARSARRRRSRPGSEAVKTSRVSRAKARSTCTRARAQPVLRVPAVVTSRPLRSPVPRRASGYSAAGCSGAGHGDPLGPVRCRRSR